MRTAFYIGTVTLILFAGRWLVSNGRYIKPNWEEGIFLALCLITLVVGIALIRRSRRPSSWDSPAQRRADLARKQKAREELPPGQL